jgi:WD40 repeat protein
MNKGYWLKILKNELDFGIQDNDELYPLLTSGIIHSLEYFGESDENIDFIEVALFEIEDPRTHQQMVDLLIRLFITKNDQPAYQLLRRLACVQLDKYVLEQVHANQVHFLDDQDKALVALFTASPEEYQQIDPQYLLLILNAIKMYDNQTWINLTTQQLNRMGLKQLTTLLQFLHSPSKELEVLIIVEYASYSITEKNSLFQICEAMLPTGNQYAQDLVGQLFIQYEEMRYLNLAKQFNTQMLSDDFQALFYFLSDQWSDYETLDFQQTYIKQIYETANIPLKRRILDHSRKSGHIAWLQDSANIRETRWLNDLTEKDWMTIIQELNQSGQKESLKKLLLVIPAYWAGFIFQALSVEEIRNLPLQSDPVLNTRLWEMSRNLKKESLTILKKHDHKLLIDNLLSSAVSGTTKYLLVGGMSNQICEFSLPKYKINLPCTLMPANQIRDLLISQDEKYWVAAFGDLKIRVYHHENGQIIKTLEGHQGLVKKLLLHPNQKSLYSISFDGTLRSWRFPLGPSLNTVKVSESECFDIAINPEGSVIYCADAGGKLTAWDSTSLKNIFTIDVSNQPLTILVAAHSEPFLAFYTTDQKIILLNHNSQIILRKIDIQDDRVTCMTFSHSDRFLLVAFQSGNIQVFSTFTGDCLLTQNIFSNPIYQIQSYETDTYVVLSRNGECTIIDIEFLENLFIPVTKLRESTLINFQKIDQNPHWRDFLLQFFQFIHQFDIEMDDITRIQVGSYDIEIE